MTLKQLLGSLIMGASLALSCQTAVKADPILDGGWASDQINDALTDSVESPYDFTLSGSAYFRITDAFVVGDTFFVYDNGTLILTTALLTPPVRSAFGDNATADAAWVSDLYQHGEIVLTAGAHSLTVQGDGAGGLPAGFYVRLDSITVPEPATLGLLALALFGVSITQRRRSRRNPRAL